MSWVMGEIAHWLPSPADPAAGDGAASAMGVGEAVELGDAAIDALGER